MGNSAQRRLIHPFADQGKFTAVHNSVFDVIMPSLPPNAFKVLCFVIRKTVGWQKESDQLSYSQIAIGTGIKSPATLRAAVKELLDGRYIIGKSTGKWDATSYRLNAALEIEVTPATENEVDNSTTEIVVATENEVVATSKTVVVPTTENEDTKERLKQKKERGGETQAHPPAVQAYFDSYPAQTLDADQIAEIARTVVDISKWREVLRYWKMSGYRAQSIPKMLDRYSSGASVADDRPGGNRTQHITRPPADLPMITAATNSAKRIPNADERRKIIEASNAKARGE